MPNYYADVQAAQIKYADAWSHAHVEGDPRRLEWIKLFAADLRKKDPKVGANGKRGNAHDLSADAINILVDVGDSLGRTPNDLPCVVVDVIGSAGIPSQYPTWGVYATLIEGSGANVDPSVVAAPAPPPTPQFPYPNEPTDVKLFQERVKAAYKSVNREFPDPNDTDAYRHFARYGYSSRGMSAQAAADKHIRELRGELGAPPE